MLSLPLGPGIGGMLGARGLDVGVDMKGSRWPCCHSLSFMHQDLGSTSHVPDPALRALGTQQ